MRSWRGLGIAILLWPLVGHAPAAAQSCDALYAELQELEGRAPDADPRRYERAFREGARELSRTQAMAEDAGCFGGDFFFFRREPAPACRFLVPRLRDLQDDLDRLDVMRRRAGSGVRNQIRSVKRRIAIRGCEDGFGSEESFGGSFGGGTYRTLCVRICDGYYFPISFATTQDRFGADAQTCSVMCPGAEARLFMHANPGGGPESMVGLDGRPYSSLPNAFRYRTSLEAGCACKAAGTLTASTGKLDLAAPVDDGSAPTPRGRPEPGEDPETLANRDGGLGSPNIEANPALGAGPAAAVATTQSASKDVRAVGPTFGPSAAQAGVVLTPVPN